MRDKVRTILKEWLQSKDDIVFTDDIAIKEVTDEIVEACRQECTIPVVSGSLPLASDEVQIDIFHKILLKHGIENRAFFTSNDWHTILNAVSEYLERWKANDR